MDSIKVVALVPTRGDRPKLLDNMRRMMRAQTMSLHGMVIVDDPPRDSTKDLTFRYRVGLDRLFAAYPDTDLVALVEDDDWYSPIYIEEMVAGWHRAGKPPIFGLGETYYYHLGVRAWHHQAHPERASAFNTFMTRTVYECMNWPHDNYVFVDIEFWKQFGKYGRTMPGKLAIGIKHGIGVTGGIGHNPKWSGYSKNRDPDMSWLKSNVDEVSFNFYSSLL